MSINKEIQQPRVVERETVPPRYTVALEGNPALGYDEMNLAEFPLASISERFVDGSKTVVIDNVGWDRERKQHISRRLTISGSDHYGLPTAKDDDVLLACIQLSSRNGFKSREVSFSRYEMLKLLRWKDETKNYRRLATALRRWKGVSLFSERAFFDRSRQSWVNRDFGILDNIYIYGRERCGHGQTVASSWFVWNEVIFESLQGGYVKRLDFALYCELVSPIAKRLYRLLDKRFYHDRRVEFDLKELAFRKLRLSATYNVAQIKRELSKAIEELESRWELRPVEPNARFVKTGKGVWTVVFERRRRRSVKTTKNLVERPDPGRLEVELSKRGIGPAVAQELVDAANAEDVEAGIELYDWYNSRGEDRGPGFLVNSIRRPEDVIPPNGFESKAAGVKRRAEAKARERNRRELLSRHEAQRAEAERRREQPFVDFWESMSDESRESFERDAVKAAQITKRQGYYRSMGREDTIFQSYRWAILRDYFEQLNGEQERARYPSESAA